MEVTRSNTCNPTHHTLTLSRMLWLRSKASFDSNFSRTDGERVYIIRDAFSLLILLSQHPMEFRLSSLTNVNTRVSDLLPDQQQLTLTPSWGDLWIPGPRTPWDLEGLISGLIRDIYEQDAAAPLMPNIFAQERFLRRIFKFYMIKVRPFESL
jgi:hypothetical protein